MSWHWRELLPVDRFAVRAADYLTDRDQTVLMFLYQPLIGAKATNLFTTLRAQLDPGVWWSSEHTHHQLMLLMNASLADIFEERKKLEAIDLLKTYRKKEEEGTSYIYELQPPMNPRAFFEDDVLSVFLYNRLGKTRYRAIRERFAVPRVDTEEYEELTYAFSEVFTSLKHSEMVPYLQSQTDEGEEEGQTTELLGREKGQLQFDSFDIDLMKQSLSSFILPQEAMNKESEQLIARLAFVYRIEPVEMGHLVGRAVRANKVDPQELRKTVQEWYKVEHGAQPPALGLKAENAHPANRRTIHTAEPQTEEEKAIVFYEQTPPLTLLELRQDGAHVAPADSKLIEELIVDYKLYPGVVNVLLDYLLFQHDMKLIEAVTLKIAAHWSRKKLQTVPEAMQLLKEETQKRRNAKEKQASRQARGYGQNTRKDALPKWLIEEREKEKEQNGSASKENHTKETTSDADDALYAELEKELKRQTQARGGS
ncbi:replication initiation and membrane attachment family protein [Shouchella shacheensis]|uniref:replication initiation and membrane attachment family protein n=1 Tax=Shouchella shacheensis TaxID=1649580 RepID=UPI0007402D88|nr:DnaD domain protein [Shouchella shacheensis]